MSERERERERERAVEKKICKMLIYHGLCYHHCMHWKEDESKKYFAIWISKARKVCASGESYEKGIYVFRNVNKYSLIWFMAFDIY